MRLRARSAAVVVVVVVAAGAAPPAAALEDGLARTPPMGWNGWYRFGCGVTEGIARRAADALVTSGMRAAGYRYVNLDDCWMSFARSRDGRLTPDRRAFPHGIAALGRYVHARGLRLGVYLSAGRMTCAGRPGSAGYLEPDVAALARWGVDYVKVDWCFARGLSAPAVFAQLRDAVRAAGRRMVVSISTWGAAEPWLWGPDAGHLWRISHDLPHIAAGDLWRSVIAVAETGGVLAPYARPGAWNDPDILPVGLRRLRPTEERTAFSLWSVMAAPLLAGADLTTMTPATRATFLNREVVAVDQDTAGAPGVRVESQGARDVWVRALAGGSRAVLLVNRAARPTSFRVDLRALTGLGAARLRIRDLWTHRTAFGRPVVVRRVAPHGVAMLRVSAAGQ